MSTPVLFRPAALSTHRVRSLADEDLVAGDVRRSPVKAAWFFGMAAGAIIGGIATFTWTAFALFVATTAFVLLFGYSLGCHRKLIHNSFACPRWLEYTLVYCGVHTGLAGPLGLMRQHELRDYAQRLPDCHDYLRHGRAPWIDAWWHLACELHLEHEPPIHVEARIARNRFYRFLELTWMLQHGLIAILFYTWGGWGLVFWGVCARVTACQFGHWFIGYVAHHAGGMHHEVRGAAVQGRNVPWASLVTMGECWHNNHHAFPGSAKLGLYEGEWDPGWWVLRLFERLGLARKIVLPEDLPQRRELVALIAAYPNPEPPGHVAQERAT